MQIEVNFFKRQFARFNFREIEDVIDYRQQRVTAGTDRLGKAALFGCQDGVEQDIGYADYPIHWGSDFMTHVCQEIALRTVRRFGRLFCVIQFQGNSFWLGQIVMAYHDVKMFERPRKGVAPTPAGKSFLIDARRILEECDASIRKAQRTRRGEIAELAIGWIDVSSIQSLRRCPSPINRSVQFWKA